MKLKLKKDTVEVLMNQSLGQIIGGSNNCTDGGNCAGGDNKETHEYYGCGHTMECANTAYNCNYTDSPLCESYDGGCGTNDNCNSPGGANSSDCGSPGDGGAGDASGGC